MNLGMHSFHHHSTYIYLHDIHPLTISSLDPDTRISPNSSSVMVYDLLQLSIMFATSLLP